MSANNIYFNAINEVEDYRDENYLIIDNKRTSLPLKIKVSRFEKALLDYVDENFSLSDVIGSPNADGQFLTGNTDGSYQWVNTPQANQTLQQVTNAQGNNTVQLLTPLKYDANDNDVLLVDGVLTQTGTYGFAMPNDTVPGVLVSGGYYTSELAFAGFNLEGDHNNDINDLRSHLLWGDTSFSSLNEKAEISVYGDTNLNKSISEMQSINSNGYVGLKVVAEGTNGYAELTDTISNFGAKYPNVNYSIKGELVDEWIPHWFSVKNFRAKIYEQERSEFNITSNSFSIDYNNGSWQKINISNNISFTYSNFPANKNVNCILIVQQDSPGGFSIDFSGSGLIIGDGLTISDLDLNTDSGGKTIFFFTWDGFDMRVWRSKDGLTI